MNGADGVLTEKSHHRHRRLLCARRQRPRDCCAAEQRDEVATFHVDHGGIPPRCAIRAADWPVLSLSAALVPRPSLGFLPDIAYPPISHAMAHSGRASPGAISF